MNDLKRSQALEREARERRTKVAYAASEVGATLTVWQPTDEYDQALTSAEAELAKLNTAVAALRALRESVRRSTWVPRPEDAR